LSSRLLKSLRPIKGKHVDVALGSIGHRKIAVEDAMNICLEKKQGKGGSVLYFDN
jgi:hypothetical protein